MSLSVSMFKEISYCRICGNTELVTVLNLVLAAA
jgi:hypothetical protein